MYGNQRMGVSPVVAVILLILVSVAAVVVLFGWLSGSAGDSPVDEARMEKVVVKGVSVRDGSVALFLQNIGSEPVEVSTVYLVDDAGNIVYRWNVSIRIGPGSTEEIVLALPAGVSPGREYRVMVGGGGSSTFSGFFTVESTGPCGFPSGWSYYRVVNISNPTSNTYSDMPVRIVLNASNFDFSKARPDGGDLRVYSSSCVELPYWVEYWDQAGQVGVVWVGLPSLPPGNTTVYIVYGNPSASTTGSPAGIGFTFYDDFESWSGWTQYRSGRIAQSDRGAFTGDYGLRKYAYCDPNGGYKSLGSSIGSDAFVLEAYVYRDNLTGCDYDRIGFIDGSGNGYGIVVKHNVDELAIDRRSSYSGYVYSSVALGSDPVREWYYARIYYIPSTDTLVAEVYALDGTLIARTSLVDHTYSQFTRVYVFGGHDYYVDNLKVYPALDDPLNPYPQVYVGDEQTIP